MKRKYVRKLSLWFPGTVPPVHVGPYQVSGEVSVVKKHKRGGKVFYSYWDGKTWGMVAMKPVVAKMLKGRANKQQQMPWRGRTAP